MDNSFSLFLSYLLAYLLGSFPSAFLVGRLRFGIDIREHGSGNMGASNVFRVLGKKWGVITLVLDIAKGGLAVVLSKQLGIVSDGFLLFSGLFAFLGHVFPIWLKFKGGKGVAVASGVFLVLKTWETLLVLLFFLLVLRVSRYVSVASILSSWLFVLIFTLNPLRKDMELAYILFSSFLALAILVSHRKNIKRLLEGKENRISFWKPKN